jgi:uncharacterized protein involved in type VI secretion and phage assembly
MSNDPHDLDRPDNALYGLYQGVVADNADPAGLGRVRVRIPGLIEEGTGWALQLGTSGGGSLGRGLFAVPEVDAEVGVLFYMGDPDQPHYLCGSWGRTGGQDDVPTSVRAVPAADRPKVKSFETEEYEMSFDDRPTSKAFKVVHKSSSTSVEINGVTGSLSINAQANVSIEANGIVDINGLVVRINGTPAGSGAL